ncbi:MAG TPA: cytochrome c peroxidase [Candidatus Saccharimonadales bacterium]|jgi:cytochrome c peroxidase|nr:cytochrome c peroxidase [Candidatus Saccharimonadales bacterium]
MREKRLIVLLIVCVSVAVALLISIRPTSAQNQQNGKADVNEPPFPIYNPYPPGILPADLNSEIARVLREIDVIENRAIQRWHALPAPTLFGVRPGPNPPVFKDTGTEAIETLGELMLFDKNMSPGRNEACTSCHMPYAGWGGPIPSVNLTMIAYPGTAHFRAGKRTPQRHTYSPFFPVLQYNNEQGLFFGGNFWDSRATGYLLRNPDAEQAQGPPVDTQEMGFPDTACVAFRLTQSVYRPLFEELWGKTSLDINFPHETEEICETPGGAAVFGGNVEPIRLSSEDRTKAKTAYDRWGLSIDAYEQSVQVSNFTSKFDAFLKGNYTMSADEMAGYALFNGKGNCNSCHVDGRGTTLQPGQTDTSTSATANPPLFTCFGSANEGLPLNPRDAFYYQTTPDSFGFVANPYGFGYRDLGMGTFLRSGFGSSANPNSKWIQDATSSAGFLTVDGQFQVATARNAAATPPQCPTTEAGIGKPYFQKGFFHNGYIKSLKQLVHFYNTRDTSFAYPVTSGHCPPGTIERVTCWPMKEVPDNLDTTTGMLGLTDTEENQIVAFLETLSDGFTSPYPNSDTFTGVCMTCNPAADPNCSPSRQGNGSLIPTPTLPPCATAICGVAPLPGPTPIP